MALMVDDQTWAVHAACAGVDPDSLFVPGAAQRQARQVCFSCPVRLDCLADALDSSTTYGVWGGLTERERRALVRAFPNEKDWNHRLRYSQDPISIELRAGRIPRFRSR